MEFRKKGIQIQEPGHEVSKENQTCAMPLEGLKFAEQLPSLGSIQIIREEPSEEVNAGLGRQDTKVRIEESSDDNWESEMEESAVIERAPEVAVIRCIARQDLKERIEKPRFKNKTGIPRQDTKRRKEKSRFENLESEIEKSAVIERVQGHENNMSLDLLKDAYSSMKRKSTPTAWKNNDFLRQKSPMGNTVLHIAAMYGYDKGADKIVRKAPHLLSAKNSNGDTALHVAAKAGHISTLRCLLATHVRNLLLSYPEQEALNEILVKNKQGNTFFHEALLNGRTDVMNFLPCNEELFEPGFIKLVEVAALFETNSKNESGLYLAIVAGDEHVVDQALTKLIEGKQEMAKLDPNGPPHLPRGKSPLFAAIKKKDPGILAKILDKQEEWIHLRDVGGMIPLHYAASMGYLEGVQDLLKKCDSCALERDNNGCFALHVASAKGYLNIVKELLKHCPDPREILDNNGRNLLHVAAESGKFEVVSHILQVADNELKKLINDQDHNGNTPLHLAALHCHPKIVHALTRDKGAKPSCTLVNENHETALDAFEKFSLENPSLRQRLTWIALKSAAVPRNVSPNTPKSYQEQKNPNMDQEQKNSNTDQEQKNPKMDPYKDRINTLMVVSTLITTVTFTAGFTMPGGTNDSSPEHGIAVMLHHIWFKLFIFFITVSMYGSISVTITLIWAQLEEVTLAYYALKVAAPLLGVTLATLSLAFLAGVHLVISDLSWLANTFLVICVIFIFILMFLYVVIWFPSSSSCPIVRFFSHCPFLVLAWLHEHEETKNSRNSLRSKPYSFLSTTFGF